MEDGASEAQIRLSHCARVHRKQRRSDCVGGLAYEDLLDRHLGSLCMDYGLQFLPLSQTRISSQRYVQCLHCFELLMSFIAQENLKHFCLLHSKLQSEMVPPLNQMVKHHLPFYHLLELVVVLIQQIETFKSAYLLYEVSDQWELLRILKDLQVYWSLNQEVAMFAYLIQNYSLCCSCFMVFLHLI